MQSQVNYFSVYCSNKIEPCIIKLASNLIKCKGVNFISSTVIKSLVMCYTAEIFIQMETCYSVLTLTVKIYFYLTHVAHLSPERKSWDRVSHSLYRAATEN